MADGGAPRVGSWRAWVPSLFLLLGVLPLVFWAEVSFHERLGGAGSAVELSRPADYLDAVQIRYVEGASRQNIADVAQRLLDPANPFGVSQSERAQAREHLARISGLLDENLWQLHQLVSALDEATVRRHQERLGDELGTLRTNAVPPEVLAAQMQQRYGLLDLGRVPVETRPADWTPGSDPQAHRRWQASFAGVGGQHSGDQFLAIQVQNLLALHLEAPTPSEDPVRAARLVRSVGAVQALGPQLRQEWINLYHRFVMPYPERAAQVPLQGRQDDLGYEEFADLMRRISR